jgi:hypothetical protein
MTLISDTLSTCLANQSLYLPFKGLTPLVLRARTINIQYLIFCIYIFLSYNQSENCSAHVLYTLYIYVYMCICFYSGLSCDVRDCLCVLCIICLFNKGYLHYSIIMSMVEGFTFLFSTKLEFYCHTDDSFIKKNTYPMLVLKQI